jgi:hypothetical protein
VHGSSGFEGGLRVPRADRAQQSLISPQLGEPHLAGRHRQMPPGLPGPGTQILDRADEPRHRCDTVHAGHETIGHALELAGRAVGFGRQSGKIVDSTSQRCDISGGGALGTTLRERGEEHLADGQQLADFVIPGRDNERTFLRHDTHESGRLEQPQRLAHRAPADAKLLGNFGGTEMRTGRDAAGPDRVADPFGDHGRATIVCHGRLHGGPTAATPAPRQFRL